MIETELKKKKHVIYFTMQPAHYLFESGSVCFSKLRKNKLDTLFSPFRFGERRLGYLRKIIFSFDVELELAG